MKQQRPYPQVIVTRKAARALASGHPWVFEGEVRRMEPAPADGRAAQNGDVVDVVEENGTWQGVGLLSEQSKIRVRVVSRNANDRINEAFWSRKLQWAWEYRKAAMGSRALPGCEPDTNCCRVLFSEADGFPGLVVDRYEDVLVSQVGTVGMQRLRPTLYPLLLDVLRADGQDIRGIYERNDAPSRLKEGLAQEKGWWVEVTTLVVPGMNDSDGELRGIAHFIKESLGADTPWHVSAFFPCYRMQDRGPTPAATVFRARQIGLAEGLHYVYSGNVRDDEGAETFCPVCGTPVVKRSGYSVLASHHGVCPKCGASIAGIWK